MDLFGTLVNGVLYKKDKSGYYVDKALFPKKKCVIESNIKGKPVSCIGHKAFKKSKIQEVVIPESINKLSIEAFSSSNLKFIKISNNVDEIWNQVFENCKNLKAVELNKKCTVVEKRCFAECYNLENINLSSLRVIGDAAFLNCISLKEVYLDSVVSINIGGFNGCVGLETVIIGDECTTIDHGAFVNCTNLSNVVIGKNVNNIGGMWGQAIAGEVRPNRDNPFEKCDNLEYLLYHGTPDEISMTVRNFFVQGCNLDIYYYSKEPKKGTWCYDNNGKIVVNV